MIATVEQYQKAQDELQHLEERLQRLQRNYPIPAKGLTKAGIRKMIARLHEELAIYEGAQEIEQPEPSM
jgi:type II secretory pathway component PulJ